MIEDDLPWYKQFWPWVLIVLPGTVVIAAFVTLWIAITHDDSVVRDDYYKEGLAINRELSQDRVAKEMGLSASLDYSRDTQSVDLKVNGLETPPPQLVLEVVHPNDSKLDLQIMLHGVGAGHYTGRADTPLSSSTRWYLQLRETTGGNSLWRLRGTLLTENDIISTELNAG